MNMTQTGLMNASGAPRRTDSSFVLRLVIKHPTLSLSAISKEMPIEMHQGHCVGDTRITPKGTRLVGLHRESFWGHSEHFSNRRDFFGCAVAFVESLQDRGDYFRGVIASGGKVALFIDILGSANIGDALAPAQLRLLSLMGVELGVEFFP